MALLASARNCPSAFAKLIVLTSITTVFEDGAILFGRSPAVPLNMAIIVKLYSEAFVVAWWVLVQVSIFFQIRNTEILSGRNTEQLNIRDGWFHMQSRTCICLFRFVQARTCSFLMLNHSGNVYQDLG